MNIWVVNFKLEASRDMEEIQDFLIANDICAMGWRLEGKKYHGQEEYLADAIAKWPHDENSIRRACGNFHRMERGDLVLVRVRAIFWIGMVADDAPFYTTTDDYPEIGELGFGWTRRVRWYKIGNQDETPAPIAAPLVQSRQKTIDIRKKHHTALYDYCKVVYNDLTGTKTFDITPRKLSEDNFAETLNSQDLEDLVGLYLQEKKGYLFFPSSCKKATKLYEYILKDRKSGCSVYVQVKHNRNIDATDFNNEDFKGHKVYLYSNSGYDNSHLLDDSIFHVIDRGELFNYFMHNKDVFQRRLRYHALLYEF